ncbi:hypothetical protein EVAR_7006_1 [Eumeta japonica]|uniref:Uncharacterized protein n=1 Tax=Eumeta variegata TaxID=151549 RepID=A0A4C1TJT3_EUMVA|nr:hypothetical protein EVAR_7006_1 [Eumeta japonica]
MKYLCLKDPVPKVPWAQNDMGIYALLWVGHIRTLELPLFTGTSIYAIDVVLHTFVIALEQPSFALHLSGLPRVYDNFPREGLESPSSRLVPTYDKETEPMSTPKESDGELKMNHNTDKMSSCMKYTEIDGRQVFCRADHIVNFVLEDQRTGPETRSRPELEPKEGPEFESKAEPDQGHGRKRDRRRANRIVGVATLAVATGRHAILGRPVTAQLFFITLLRGKHASHQRVDGHRYPWTPAKPRGVCRTSHETAHEQYGGRTPAVKVVLMVFPANATTTHKLRDSNEVE